MTFLKHSTVIFIVIFLSSLLMACGAGPQERGANTSISEATPQESGDLAMEPTPKPSPTPQILSDAEEKQMEGLAKASLDKAITDYGEAYSLDDRIRAVGDLNADRKRDVADLFCIAPKGGNSYYCYLAAYVNVKGRFKPVGMVQAGHIYSEVADKIRIEKGKIVADTLVWAEEDALCCPSRTGVMTFEIRGGILKESRKS